MKRQILIAISICLLTACEKDDGKIVYPYNPENPIVGVWHQVSRTFLQYDTHSGDIANSNHDNVAAQSYLMLMDNGSLYFGSYTNEAERMNIGTYEYQEDSIFFNSSLFVGQERQAVLELAREVMRLEYISDDGSDDGTMDVVRVTYKRIEN